MLTGFDGQPDKLYLTTLSHVRTIQDSPESDQAKVAYYLKDVKSIQDGESTKALIRRESTFLNGDDIEKDGSETILLEHVDTIEIPLFGRRRQRVGRHLEEHEQSRRQNQKSLSRRRGDLAFYRSTAEEKCLCRRSPQFT